MSRKNILLSAFLFFCLQSQAQPDIIRLAPGGQGFQTAAGKPFFWLGDTGWLLFVKCTREDAIRYLDARKKQGFNLIQVMVLHNLPNTVNVYGDSALRKLDIAQPIVTEGSLADDANQYDYWDHVEFIIREAGKRNMQMALVPMWGSNIKIGKPNAFQIKTYADFISKRLGHLNNIIWLNGGDVSPADAMDLWDLMGKTIKQNDAKHLMTYHPRGRYSSSEWFHAAPWLDFNMFQSGHKSYAQDTSAKDKYHYGEDNWMHVVKDLGITPHKPTLDGEPSYENIPHGLHDSLDRRWTAHDIRRYAYWSVLSGASGFTYDENAVMQFHHLGDKDANFGVNQPWEAALYSAGAKQMQYLFSLMQLFGSSHWRQVQSAIVENGNRYERVAAAASADIAVMYSFTGKPFNIDLSQLLVKPIKSAYWLDPSTGKKQNANIVLNGSITTVYPQQMKSTAPDRVLVLLNK